ncbi:hypothetical protein LAZ67_X001650 [Cordylochernes scorpioides]|uniref:Retrovirus-related Pol polyprotein from transposon TNT 1-94-like beta-barrel domain-containing protein n=1 Tax=Cordylochernes scorpioides TaxID=51811 RepID=A0ABY6LUQ9_9ARAC|nr:hypothetical protein LAZ67_X001650 [Cordylochernes scorpioides]
MNPNDNIATHISKVETLAQQMKDLAWDSVSSEEKTLENLTARLLKEESLQDHWDSSGNSKPDNALMTFSKFNRNSTASNKQQQHQQSIKDKKKNTHCGYCKKKGHWWKECYKRKEEQKGQQPSSSSRDDSCAFSAETSAFLAETKDSWFADSGATDHMTFRREWFSTFEEIPEGVHPVCLGDGKKIYAKEGREDVNDEERAGRPSTSTTDEKINEVEKMILANRRITVREVAEDLNISIGSCHSIFINDLGMRRVAAKFVPKLLNCDQKQHRMNIANEMLDSVRDDPNLLQRVITGDEAWVYGYDVETKAQLSQWKLPARTKTEKAGQVRSNVKVLLTVFFDCRGVVHHEFLPQGRTVNKEYYLQVLRNLREAIRQKRSDLWKDKNWLLHHDNALAHTSLLVRDFLAKNNTLIMPQPPYSPDLAPCDFFLFPKLKRPMKGRRCATLDEIKTASIEELKKILKNDFLKCFEDWKKPLAQVYNISWGLL